jgi:hypothetical protein
MFNKNFDAHNQQDKTAGKLRERLESAPENIAHANTYGGENRSCDGYQQRRHPNIFI